MKTLTVTIITLSIFHLYKASQISVNPIYEIVANKNFKKCYVCEENCSEPTLENCARTSECFSKTTKSGTTTVEKKGCVDSNVEVCENTDEETSCYTCSGDFCNADVSTTEEEDLGVSRCYVCLDECPEPAVQHDCREALEAKEGKVVKAACLTYQIQKKDGVAISKGCIPDNHVIRQTCLLQNSVSQEVTCSICDTDRCNLGDNNENYANECYHCDGSCDNPIVQKCEEILGEGAKSKCVAAERTNANGENDHWRTCVEITTTVQVECALINEQGGNCTICDTNLCNKNHETSLGVTFLSSFFIIVSTIIMMAFV